MGDRECFGRPAGMEYACGVSHRWCGSRSGSGEVGYSARGGRCRGVGSNLSLDGICPGLGAAREDQTFLLRDDVLNTSLWPPRCPALVLSAVMAFQSNPDGLDDGP